jgi:hypothetical protein
MCEKTLAIRRIADSSCCLSALLYTPVPVSLLFCVILLHATCHGGREDLMRSSTRSLTVARDTSSLASACPAKSSSASAAGFVSNNASLFDSTSANGPCFASCTESLCGCIRDFISPLSLSRTLEYDSTQGKCVAVTVADLQEIHNKSTKRKTILADAACSGYQACIRSFTVCTAVKAITTHFGEEEEEHVSAGCRAWADALALPTLDYISSKTPTAFTSSAAFQSCRAFVCSDSAANASAAFLSAVEDGGGWEMMTVDASCTPFPPLDCPPPFAPLLEDGSNATSLQRTNAPPPSAVAARFSGTLRIPGAFAKFFSVTAGSASALDRMRQAVAWAVGNLTGSTQVSILDLQEGSLVAQFQFFMPVAGRSAGESAIASALASPRAGWLRSVQSVYQTYYPNIPLSSAVSISYAVELVLWEGAQSLSSGTTAPCGPACVAGVIIGGVLFIVLLVWIAISWHRGPTGFKLVERPHAPLGQGS